MCKIKLFISGSCPTLNLVLTNVMGRPRHTDAKNTKNDVEKYQGPTTSQKKM
jgi:hypothetical protein